MKRLVAAAVWLPAVSAFAGQVCDTSVYSLSAPSSRFVDHADGTVTDRQSQLMWMRCLAGQRWSGTVCTGDSQALSWGQAQQFAGDVNRAGTYFFNDWRLPTLPELATITERQCRNPRINTAVFPGTPLAFFWTGTARPGAGDGASAYVLDFAADGIEYANKSQVHQARLVRSAL